MFISKLLFSVAFAVLGLGISIYMLILVANFLRAATDACRVYADNNRRS